jgi:aspartate aminotransferase-like enzyme
VSAIGLQPLDLKGVRFASASSGKGLASYPGLAIVFHDGRLANSARVPRYLDLAAYEAAGSVPYTHSSNLVEALACALAQTDWARKFEDVRRVSQSLRDDLRHRALPPLASNAHAAPGVITLALPNDVPSAHVAHTLGNQGIEIAWHSPYLRERNWIQIALMGERDPAAISALPDALSAAVNNSRIRQRRAG